MPSYIKVVKITMGMSFGLILSTNMAYAQNISCDGRNVQSLNFAGGTLQSGTALSAGAVYAYPSIFAGVNGEFQILSFVNGASLGAIDNDGSLSRNLQPELIPNANGGGLVNFRVSFFDAATGNPIALDISASQIDVDGDNVTLREFVEFQDRFVEFSLNNPTNLQVDASGPSVAGRRRFETVNATVAPGIDITATRNIVRAIYTNSTSFEFALGTLGAGATTRLTSLSFDCPAFTVRNSTQSSANLVTVKSLASTNSAPAGGDVVTYNITVSNQGPNGASGVNLTDLIPSGLTLSGNNGNVTQGIYNSANGLWNVGALDAGGSATLTIEGTVDIGQGGDTIANTTSAAVADQPDPNNNGDDLSEDVTVTSTVDLVITKTNTPGENAEIDQTDDILVATETTTYVITVTNNGPDAAIGAIVTDTIGSGLTCDATNPVTLSGDGVPSGSFTVSDLIGAGITLGTLSSGQSVILSYSCIVG